MAAPGYFKFEAGIRHVTVHVVHVGKLSLIFTPWDWPRVDSFFEHATHLKNPGLPLMPGTLMQLKSLVHLKSDLHRKPISSEHQQTYLYG